MKELKKGKHFWRKYIYQILLVILVMVGFGRWFGPGIITSGDWYYINPERVAEYASWPQLFEESYGITSYLGLTLHSTPLRFIIGLTYLITKIDFSYLSIVFYFGFSLLVTTTGMWLLARRLWQSPLASFLATSLYLFNSYALIIFTGGQMLGAVGYGLIPWIILTFDRLLEKNSVSRVATFILVMQLQILYDPRFFIIVVPILFFWLVARWSLIKSKVIFFKYLTATVVVFVAQNLYWLYGLFGVRGSNSGITLAGYDNVGWVYALSYSNIKHALFLHHLWWPTVTTGVRYDPNILFGLIPVIALFSLLIKERRRLWWTLLLLAGIGVFLAKGINEPAGYIYAWLFENFPGFKVFRDPAKFFTIVAFCYSLLFTAGWLKLKYIIERKSSRVMFLVGFSTYISIFVFGNSSLWLQQIKGTFIKQPRMITVSQELRRYVDQQKEYGRILWVPRMYRYTLFTNKLATLDANNIQYTTWLNFPGVEPIENLTHNRLLPFLLDANNVSIVAIPGDPNDEIYRYTKKTKEEFLADWRATNLFDEEKEIIDEQGQVTTLFFRESLGGVFTSNSLIVTEDKDIDSFGSLISPQVEVNTVAATNLDSIEQQDFIDRANYIILSPTTDLTRVKQGFVDWKVLVPETGSYNLYLPKQKGNITYNLDDQKLAPEQEIQFSNKIFWKFVVEELSEGNHKLTINLNNLNNEASEVVNLGVSSEDWFACDGRLEVERIYFEARSKKVGLNSVLRLSGGSGINACLQKTLPGENSHGLFVVYFEGQYSGEGSNIVGEFVPRYGEEVQIQQDEFFIPFYTDRKYDNFRLRIGVGAGGQNSTLVETLHLYHLSNDYQKLTNVVLQNRDRQAPSSQAAVSEYRRINESRRSFVLNNNISGTVINYSASFDSNWQLKHIGTGQIVENHFDSNFGLNGWWVPANLNGQFEIYYEPTAKIYLFSLFSLLTFMSLITYLGFYYWFNFKPRKR